jgi:hypothetical protein
LTVAVRPDTCPDQPSKLFDFLLHQASVVLNHSAYQVYLCSFLLVYEIACSQSFLEPSLARLFSDWLTRSIESSYFFGGTGPLKQALFVFQALTYKNIYL